MRLTTKSRITSASSVCCELMMKGKVWQESPPESLVCVSALTDSGLDGLWLVSVSSSLPSTNCLLFHCHSNVKPATLVPKSLQIISRRFPIFYSLQLLPQYPLRRRPAHFTVLPRRNFPNPHLHPTFYTPSTTSTSIAGSQIPWISTIYPSSYHILPDLPTFCPVCSRCTGRPRAKIPPTRSERCHFRFLSRPISSFCLLDSIHSSQSTGFSSLTTCDNHQGLVNRRMTAV